MLRLIALACACAFVAAQNTTTGSEQEVVNSTMSSTEASTTATTTTTTQASVGDVPADRPVFKMHNNAIELKTKGFEVNTANSSLAIDETSLTVDTNMLTLQASEVNLDGAATQLGSDVAHIKTSTQDGVAIQARELDINVASSATLSSDRTLSVTADDLNVRAQRLMMMAQSVGLTGNINANGETVQLHVGDSAINVSPQRAEVEADSITVKASNSASLQASSVTVGSSDHGVVADDTGVKVTSKGKITFKTAKRTITLDDIMKKLDQLNTQVGSLETNFTTATTDINASVATNNNTIDELAQAEETLSSALSTQAAELDTQALSLAAYLDDTELDLDEALGDAIDSLDAHVADVEVVMTAAGAQKDVVSNKVSAIRSTMQAKIDDLYANFITDLNEYTPRGLSTSLSTAISTLEDAVTDATTLNSAAIDKAGDDASAISSKVPSTHTALDASKVAFESTDVALNRRISVAEVAVEGLASDISQEISRGDAAEGLIPSLSTMVETPARRPNAAIIAALSKPIKQMTSDVNVMKSHINEQLGSMEFSGTLTPSIVTTYDYYGSRCAYYDDVAACGNPYNSNGRVDVFVISPENGTAVRSESLSAPSTLRPLSTGYFGNDVALNDKWLVVGAPDDYMSSSSFTRTGRVYVFARGTGKGRYQASTAMDFTAPRSVSSDDCGYTVAVSGDMVAFTCPYGEDVSTSEGILSVWEYSSTNRRFEHLRTGRHTGASSYHYAGRSLYDSSWASQALAANDGVIVVGVPQVDSPASNVGIVFAYTKVNNVISEVQSIEAPPTRVSSGYCGNAVLFKGDYMIFSCPGRAVNTVLGAGQIHIYKYNAATKTTAPFTFVQTVVSPDLARYDYCGMYLGLSDDGKWLTFNCYNVNDLYKGILHQFVLDPTDSKFKFESSVAGTVNSGYFARGNSYPTKNYMAIGDGYDATAGTRTGAVHITRSRFPEL